MRRSETSSRRVLAAEAWRNAADTIGDVTPGLSLFAVTRGQFSMIDAVEHVIRQIGPDATISLWTWTIAEYEIERFEHLTANGDVARGLLVIDGGARAKNAPLIARWKQRYGAESVRYVRNHAKIATVEANGLRVLLRGSMNLNHNPRFEQLDVTEGGPDFDLVREIESEIPVLPDLATGDQVWAATGIGPASHSQIDVFRNVAPWQMGLRTWNK